MINSEPYNKFINRKIYINQEIIATELKQELIDMYSFKMNEYSDNINSWSSRRHDEMSLEEAFRNAKKFINPHE